MVIARKRPYYAILIIGVILLGLLSRKLPYLPDWTGDILWGLMVFLIIGFVFRGTTALNNAMLSAIFSTGIELAKLCHAPWLEAIRYTTLGGLILGYVFSLQNILCYFTGISVGVICENVWLSRGQSENLTSWGQER